MRIVFSETQFKRSSYQHLYLEFIVVKWKLFSIQKAVFFRSVQINLYFVFIRACICVKDVQLLIFIILLLD